MIASGRFGGAVAVVTGAASGIGLATARALDAEGAIVWLVDRDEARLEEARGGLSDARSHSAMVLDVTDEAGWHELHRRIAERHGWLDVLVNNAGMARNQAIGNTTFADWREILAVNLDSVFLGTRTMLPLLSCAARRGRRKAAAIVNVSSVRGIIGGRNFAAYCASKGAVRMFTKAAALECAALGAAIRVNSIHPGFIETPMTDAALADEEARARRVAEIPLGRGGTAGEIAAGIVFLASDDASYMTGAELVIDGGTIAQ
jgi:meso-butanediol dehydrogenase / (S,S)-butanediol dehydrogenase / diacetyl reductase